VCVCVCAEGEGTWKCASLRSRLCTHRFAARCVWRVTITFDKYVYSLITMTAIFSSAYFKGGLLELDLLLLRLFLLELHQRGDVGNLRLLRMCGKEISEVM
jgi:hypothetical protein